MATETANRAAESLLPAGLLDSTAREAILSATMPAFLSARDGSRILWSSHEAADRFGHPHGLAFMRAGLPPLAAGTQRLAVLGRGIDPDAPKRLERLRFNVGFRSLVLTALCEPVRLTDGGLALLVSFIDAKPVRAGEPMPADAEEAAMQMELPSLAPPLARRHDDPVPVIPAPENAPENAPEVATPAAAPSDRASPVWVDQPADARKTLRFVFALDADGIVERVTPPLAEAVGAGNADLVGQSLAGVVDTFDEPAAEAIRAAILGGETWNGIAVRWPVAGTDLAIPVDLSALPQISGDAGLTGFAGFGRCHLGRAETVATPVVDVQEAPEQADTAPMPLPAEAAAEEAVATAETPAVDPDLASALEAFGMVDDTDVDDASPDNFGDIVAEGDAAGAEAEADAAPEPAPAASTKPVPEASPVPANREETTGQNVVSLRTGQPTIPQPYGKSGLSMAERNAFREIARALGAKFDPDSEVPPPVVRAPEAATPSESPAKPEAQVSAFSPMLPAAPLPLPTSGATGTELLDRLPIGVLVLRDDQPLFANQTLLDLTGYHDFRTFQAEDGAKAIFRKGSLPRDREGGFDTVVLASRDGEMIPVDAHLQLTDWRGEKATLVSLRRAVELEQGKALRSVALDLKRVRAEAQELRAVLDTATDGVITLDEKGRILSLNGAAEALFGLSQNEVAGESFTTLLLNESHAEALDYLEGLKTNGVRSVLNDGRDVFGREKKGGRIPLFMTLGRISDDEPRRYCAVLRDLTSWKRAEAELTDARRAAELASAKKSDFLTKISHEIRTPMNAIIGFAEVMMEERLGPVGNPKYKEYLGDIRTSGKHVVSLVNDLLDLAKIEAGRMEMTFAATDLNAIVASSVGIIQPQANANRVLVRTQLAQKLPQVVADERSIRQIILNMLSNATRFTESGGQVIVVTALLESGEAVIRIRDTGVGMSTSEIEQALEPFRQVGTRRDHGGTGLGLPLTKALVEANRANFAIRSTPGEGTMIEITFPSTRVLAE